MLMHGAKCSIGDQLSPDGKIDSEVYGLVGQVYQEIERKEPWCEGAQPLSEIGVFTPEEFTGGEVGMLPEAIKGATRILEQGSYQFDLLDSASDLSKYRLLVLPDCIPVSAEFAQELEEYIEGGGSLIATFASGMDETRTRFTTGLFGVTAGDMGPRDLNGNLVRGSRTHRRPRDGEPNA